MCYSRSGVEDTLAGGEKSRNEGQESQSRRGIERNVKNEGRRRAEQERLWRKEMGGGN